MRGKPSVSARAGRVAGALRQRPAPVKSRCDFSALSDAELDELALLADKAAAAGGEPAWTAEELAALERLGAKVACGAETGR